MKTTINVKWFTDSGHGWLRVPKSALIKMGMYPLISYYSYETAQYIYLEEDKDASLFFEQCNNNPSIFIRVLPSPFKHPDRSHVRRYDRVGHYGAIGY